MKEMKEKEVREVLKRARELIAPEGAWIQWEHAEMRGGAAINPESPVACRWCLTGAIRRAALHHPGGTWPLMPRAFARVARVAREPESELQWDTGGQAAREIVSWNDAPERTHAEVLALLDRAIAA